MLSVAITILIAAAPAQESPRVDRFPLGPLAAAATDSPPATPPRS